MNNVLVDKDGNILNPKIPRYEKKLIFSEEEFDTGILYRDHKKIYGKVFHGIKNGPLQFDISDLDIDKVVPPTHGTIHVQESADDQFRGVSSYGSPANYVSYEVQLNTGLLSIGGADGAYSQGEVEFLLFYTKKTDTGS